MAEETRRLAWVVLQTANRTQAKGSSVRLVIPRAPEVTDELKPPLSEVELLEVEEYLLERGYVAPDDIGLRWGTYTITPAGFYFLEAGLPEPKDSLRELAEEAGQEAALDSAIQSELTEERRQMEEVERELKEVRQKLPGGASEEPESSGLIPLPTPAAKLRRPQRTHKSRRRSARDGSGGSSGCSCRLAGESTLFALDFVLLGTPREHHQVNDRHSGRQGAQQRHS